MLLDAVCQVTGVPEKFNGWPEGYRAIQVWDNRMPSYFFRIFGRPVRCSVCECERSNEPSITQALHLMNSAEITDKMRARRDGPPPGRIREGAGGADRRAVPGGAGPFPDRARAGRDVEGLRGPAPTAGPPPRTCSGRC